MGWWPPACERITLGGRGLGVGAAGQDTGSVVRGRPVAPGAEAQLVDQRFVLGQARQMPAVEVASCWRKLADGRGRQAKSDATLPLLDACLLVLETGRSWCWSTGREQTGAPPRTRAPRRSSAPLGHDQTSPVALISGLSADALRWRPDELGIRRRWHAGIAGLGRGGRWRRRHRASRQQQRRRPAARRDRLWNQQPGPARPRGARRVARGSRAQAARASSVSS